MFHRHRIVEDDDSEDELDELDELEQYEYYSDAEVYLWLVLHIIIRVGWSYT